MWLVLLRTIGIDSTYRIMWSVDIEIIRVKV